MLSYKLALPQCALGRQELRESNPSGLRGQYRDSLWDTMLKNTFPSMLSFSFLNWIVLAV